MPFPAIGGAIASAIGRTMASTYGRVLASRAIPYISQFARGFGRSLVPVYGTVSNLSYAQKLQKPLAAARLTGGVVGDVSVGAMTAAYAYSISQEGYARLKRGRSRTSAGGRRRRRYLEE